MKMLKTGFVLGTALGVALLFSATPSNATQKYAKETEQEMSRLPHEGSQEGRHRSSAERVRKEVCRERTQTA